MTDRERRREEEATIARLIEIAIEGARRIYPAETRHAPSHEALEAYTRLLLARAADRMRRGGR